MKGPVKCHCDIVSREEESLCVPAVVCQVVNRRCQDPADGQY